MCVCVCVYVRVCCRTTGQGIAVGGSNSAAVEGANNELLNVAATEITVHMARSVAASSKRLDRAAHAAARRFVRTLVRMAHTHTHVHGPLDTYWQTGQGIANVPP